MTVTVRVPGPLRRLSEGNASVNVEAAKVREAIDALESLYPGFRQRLCDDQGDLRQFVNIYLNDQDIRFHNGLDTALGDGDSLSIIPAVAGGVSVGRWPAAG